METTRWILQSALVAGLCANLIHRRIVGRGDLFVAPVGLWHSAMLMWISAIMGTPLLELYDLVPSGLASLLTTSVLLLWQLISMWRRQNHEAHVPTRE